MLFSLLTAGVVGILTGLCVLHESEFFIKSTVVRFTLFTVTYIITCWVSFLFIHLQKQNEFKANIVICILIAFYFLAHLYFSK